MLSHMKCGQAGCENARRVGADYCPEHNPTDTFEQWLERTGQRTKNVGAIDLARKAWRAAQGSAPQDELQEPKLSSEGERSGLSHPVILDSSPSPAFDKFWEEEWESDTQFNPGTEVLFRRVAESAWQAAQGSAPTGAPAASGREAEWSTLSRDRRELATRIAVAFRKREPHYDAWAEQLKVLWEVADKAAAPRPELAANAELDTKEERLPGERK